MMSCFRQDGHIRVSDRALLHQAEVHALLQVRSLAKTVDDTRKIEQRLEDMYLLHQKIEEQNQQLRMIVALHNDVLESQDVM